MISIKRLTMIALAAAFSSYHIVRGIVTMEQFTSPWPVVVALVLYFLVTAFSLWPTQDSRIPSWLASLNLAMAVTIPLLVTSQLDPSGRIGYASWHVSAVGTLMVITMVRGREWFAWAGVGFLTVQSLLWCGLGGSLENGVSGAIVWVIVARFLTRSLVKVERDAEQLGRTERAAARWQASQAAHEQERRHRLEQTGQRAIPMLRDIILTGGALSEVKRAECRVLEAGLRDEIRGRKLLDDRTRQSILDARRRGILVSVLDEGTIDDLSQDDLDTVLEQVADAIDGCSAERMIVRTGPIDSAVAVTVVALGPSDDPDDDDDTVTLWLEVKRPAAVIEAATA